MRDLLFYWLAGALLGNSVPHLGQGTAGHPFPTPWAVPPGVGLSSPLVNVLWGAANLAGAYLFAKRVGRFDLREWRHAAAFFAGFVAAAIVAAQCFGPH